MFTLGYPPRERGIAARREDGFHRDRLRNYRERLLVTQNRIEDTPSKEDKKKTRKKTLKRGTGKEKESKIEARCSMRVGFNEVGEMVSLYEAVSRPPCDVMSWFPCRQTAQLRGR